VSLSPHYPPAGTHDCHAWPSSIPCHTHHSSHQHPNIISYNEAFLDGNRLCIIMEYAADGDLAKVIKKYQLLKRPLPEDLIWKYWIQVTRGLAALHNTKILHRDIKPGEGSSAM